MQNRVPAKKPLELDLLRSCAAFESLSSADLYCLAGKTALLELGSGQLLFKEGSADDQTLYLVHGVVELLHAGRVVHRIQAGTPQARQPIAPSMPRRYSARVASSQALYLSIPNDALAALSALQDDGVYAVAELQNDSIEVQESVDWMSALLRTKAYYRLPAANLQAMLLRMERVAFASGEILIRQGEAGDYFYVVVQGRCAVIRSTGQDRKTIRLTQFGLGDCFGSDALVTGEPRHASVVATTDMQLMRLNADDFRSLVAQSMFDRVDLAAATRIVNAGGRWLDVRMPAEFQRSHFNNALNIPLYSIRLKLNQLDPKVHYITCCQDGRLSAGAAFILCESGWQASALQDGLPAEQRAQALDCGNSR